MALSPRRNQYKYSILGSAAAAFLLFLQPLTALGIHTSIPTPLFQVQENMPSSTYVALSNWRINLNKNMSLVLCQPGTYWRNCYQVDDRECQELVNSITTACTTKMANFLPMTLTPTVAGLAGQQAGFCVGELFYKLSQHRLKSVPECQKQPGGS